MPDSFEAPNPTIQTVKQASVQFQNDLDHDTSSPSSKPTPKRKRKPNRNMNDEVSAEETSDVYTFIDDEPVSKKKRSTVRQKKKKIKKQWPILEKKIELPRKPKHYSFKPKTPVGGSILMQSDVGKTGVQRILQNMRKINAMAAKQNTNTRRSNATYSYRKSANKIRKI